MTVLPRRHNVFVNYFDDDRAHKDKCDHLMNGHLIDKSVRVDDIDDMGLRTETIFQNIRDRFMADATVTVVLIGPETWSRKYVDWEIGSSLRDTKNSSRCGLLGILLPNHPDCGKDAPDHHRLPPRFAANMVGRDPCAKLYTWPKRQAASQIRRWIHEAFARRKGTPPDNSLDRFARNRRTRGRDGWG